MSKFLDDLQRWTEAQVAAILRGQIGAKRKDYLAADINKLLRDRINDPLTIKVGDAVGAEFLRTNRRNGAGLKFTSVLSGLFTGTQANPYTDGEFQYVYFVVHDGGYNFHRTERQSTTALLDSLAYDDNYDYRFKLMPCTYVSEGAWIGPTTAYSGMYTGEMRKVAQLLYGLGTEVPYSYCWQKTHGIFIDLVGRPWVIEVSNEDGITAWPLATSAPDSYLREVTGLKYIPVPVSALLPLGSRRQLANAEDLAEYADFGTLFTECGWAFDSNGRNAVNVAFEFIDNGNTFTGWKTHLFKIIIAGDEGGPTIATVVDAEQTYLFANNWSLCPIKYPTYNGTSGVFFRVFNELINDGTPPGDYNNGIFHAWYDGDDLMIARRNLTYASVKNVDTRPSGPSYGCISGHAIPFGGSGSHEFGRYQKTEDYLFSIDNGNSGFSDYVWGEKFIGKPERIDYAWTSIGSAVRASYYGGSPIGIASNCSWVSDKSTTYDANRPVILQAAIIPFHTRTGVYFYRTVQEVAAAAIYTSSEEKNVWAHGEFEIAWPYSKAYCITPNCVCGENSPPGVFKYIGWWGTQSYLNGDGTPFNLSGGDLLERYGPDPVYPDRTLYCYTGGDTGEYSCSLAATVTVTEEDPIASSQELKFSFGKNVITLISNADFDVYNEYTNYDRDTMASYGQAMFATLDAFSNAGAIYVTTDGSTIHYEKGANIIYPGIESIRPYSIGWFGVPFPDLK